MNGTLKSFILLAFMTALFVGVGAMVGGSGGAMIAFGLACVMNVVAWWNSGSIVLRLYKAREVTADDAGDLYDITHQMAKNAGMPMPKLYIIDNDQPNAFATGRNPENGAVAVTTGLLNVLNMQEVAGVIAHELAHIKNRDTLIMTITATIAGALSMLANMALFMGGGSNSSENRMGPIAILIVSLLAPLAASIVQMAISRTREYEADKIGAEICGRPVWLADALGKIAMGTKTIDNEQAEQNPATAHMFIMNPLHVHAIDGLFSTHPRTEERIARLHAQARALGQMA